MINLMDSAMQFLLYCLLPQQLNSWKMALIFHFEGLTPKTQSRAFWNSCCVVSSLWMFFEMNELESLEDSSVPSE